MITQHPIPKFISNLKSETDISFKAEYLGKCLIDTYRQSGDLDESIYDDLGRLLCHKEDG